MANEPKMKIGIGADTGDFDKGAKKVKQEMKDLSKVSSDAFGAIGNAIGVDTGKLTQFSSALQGLGRKFTEMGTEGSKAFGQVLTSIAPVAAGIAGLGLAGAIALFKQLNAEADAFESTIQGGVIKAQTEAYVSTFTQALRDMKGVGQAASEGRASWKEGWRRFLAGMNPMNNLETLSAADAAGKRAKEIATELYNIDLKRKEVSVQISELDAQIAQKREVISDTTRSAGERAKALADAQELIKQKMDLQLPLAEKQRDLLIEYNGLASTTIKDYDAEIAAKINVNNLIQQEAAEQRGLLRQQKQINAELQKEKEERENIERIKALRASGNELQAITGGADLSSYNRVTTVPVVPVIEPQVLSQFKEYVLAEIGDIRLTFTIDPENIDTIKLDITNEIQNLAVGLSSAIGTLTADLINGEDAWGNFANAAMNAFGDMAIAIGKIAIEAGMASEGIKVALEMGGGYVAIAAGLALVALGAAVKAGMSNIANGNYSSTTSVASSTSSSIGNGYEQRDVYVNVQGTLVADGDQLLAVLNNTNKRNKSIT